MSTDSAKVSVVIPTLNAGAGFKDVLEGISAQEGGFSRELVIVDSGSTDGTPDLAQRYGATVQRIPRAAFDHGTTRNLGIELASGEYVSLTVQDAVPRDRRWLASMVETLDGDGRVAGVYGRQLARPDCGDLARAVVNSRAAARPDRREQVVGDRARYSALSPMARRELAAFDNVNSCVRRSVWTEIPFEEGSFAEDLRWGKQVIEAGYKLVYEPRATVLHSHERGALYDLRRHYVDQTALLELFGVRLIPNLPRLSVGVAWSALRYYWLLRDQGRNNARLRPLVLALRHAVPTQVGTYLGAKDELLARLGPRIYRELHERLSGGI